MSIQTLKSLADALAQKKISSRELVGDYLARIDALNPRLNAFITVDRDGALAAADAADAAIAAGRAAAAPAPIPCSMRSPSKISIEFANAQPAADIENSATPINSIGLRP